LIPKPDGKGRVAAIEILKSTMRTREYIEKGEQDGKSLIRRDGAGDQDGNANIRRRYRADGSNRSLNAGGRDAYATNANNLLLRLGDLAATRPRRQNHPPEDESMLDMIER